MRSFTRARRAEEAELLVDRSVDRVRAVGAALRRFADGYVVGRAELTRGPTQRPAPGEGAAEAGVARGHRAAPLGTPDVRRRREGAATRRGNIGALDRARRIGDREAPDLRLVDLARRHLGASAPRDPRVPAARGRDPPDGHVEVAGTSGRRRDGTRQPGQKNRGDQGTLNCLSPKFTDGAIPGMLCSVRATAHRSVLFTTWRALLDRPMRNCPDVRHLRRGSV